MFRVSNDATTNHQLPTLSTISTLPPMLDNYKNSPDAKFAADISSIAQSLQTMSQSIAIIAGCLARRDGIHYQQPPATDTHHQDPSPSNHSPMTPEDTIPLQSTIETVYGTLNSDYSLPC